MKIESYQYSHVCLTLIEDHNHTTKIINVEYVDDCEHLFSTLNEFLMLYKSVILHFAKQYEANKICSPRLQ